MKTNKRRARGPKFVAYMGPVLDALRKLGGSGRPAEVQDLIAGALGIPGEEQEAQYESGGTRFATQVHFARLYLVKAGLLDSSTRGVWSLTEKGRGAQLEHEEALQIFRDIHKEFGPKRASTSLLEAESLTPEGDETSDNYRSDLLRLLMDLPPAGFEQLCQRLLRESGFEQVTVTGKSGDGGLDGNGVLQVNPFVSFRVYFQCKRYKDTVGPGTVRDFRRAMMGRADKGIILSTGSFTAEARREAVRDGVPPIELVDGERLIDLFEQLELGLRPRKTYDIDHGFFAEFQRVK